MSTSPTPGGMSSAAHVPRAADDRGRRRSVTLAWSAAVAAACALVLLRSWVFLAWEQSCFDGDQAVFGLMAKHLAEGRTFPLFMYGQRYALAVSAWLAAPLVAVFGTTVFAVKAPVVLVNLLAAILLLRSLVRDAGLAPSLALGGPMSSTT